jgi:type IX secretion system PorP/SprF family membrane protein
MMNNFLQNPAFAGKNEYSEAIIEYRNQWTGLSGAPKTIYASVQGRFKSKNSSRGIADNSFDGKHKAAHAWGVALSSDKFGPTTYNSLFVTYAYHLPISKKLYASVGVSPGVVNYVLDGDKLNLPEKAIDNTVAFQRLSVIKPDINVGATLYGKNFYVGISSFQLLRNKVYDDLLLDEHSMRIHYTITGEVRFKKNDYSFMPSFLVKYVKGAPLTADACFRVGYKNIIWAGVSYRTEDAFAILLGYNITNAFYVGYSYDYTLSPLNKFNTGTHEIMLAYKFGRAANTGSKPAF